jgi:pentatricopeptide repeat protein
MREAGLQPDAITYTTVMRVHAKYGEAAKALQLLQRMRADGVACSVITYLAVMDACSKGGAWESALQLLAEMRQAGVEPDIKVWNALLAALGRAQQLELMLKQYEAMKAAGAVANLSTYYTLTSAFAIAGRESSVDKLYSEALVCGAVDPYAFNRMPAVERREHNFDAQGTLLDLRGLNVPMALAAVRRALRLVAEGGHACPLLIVTGRGAVARVTPVRDAVTAMLQERELAHAVSPHKAGVVVVSQPAQA